MCLLDLENLTFSIPVFRTITHQSVYHFWKKSTQFCSNWVFFNIICSKYNLFMQLGSFISDENPPIAIPKGRLIYVYHVNVRPPWSCSYWLCSGLCHSSFRVPSNLFWLAIATAVLHNIRPIDGPTNVYVYMDHYNMKHQIISSGLVIFFCITMLNVLMSQSVSWKKNLWLITSLYHWYDGFEMLVGKASDSTCVMFTNFSKLQDVKSHHMLLFMWKWHSKLPCVQFKMLITS